MSKMTLLVDGKPIGKTMDGHVIVNKSRSLGMSEMLPFQATSASFTLDTKDTRLNYIAMADLFGVKIVAADHLFETRRPCKWHRKRRIAKKWQKRYGDNPKTYIVSVDGLHAVQIGNTLYLHSKTIEKLKTGGI